MKRSWFSRHPICFMALYLLFYLSAFNFLNTQIHMPHIPREDFWRLCLPLFAGMTIALACYVILPTGLALRPYYVPGNDFFARTVRMLYHTDTPTNVCPSIHVFNSVTLLLAYYRCRIFEQPRRVLHRAAQAAQLHRCGAGRLAGTGTGCPVHPLRGAQRSAADAVELIRKKRALSNDGALFLL